MVPALAVILLAVTGFLAAAGVTPLLAWTPTILDPATYPLVFTVLGLLVAALAICGDHGRKILLAAGSLAAMAAFSPFFAVGSVAYIALVHALLFARVHRAWKLAFLVASVAFAVVALPRDATLRRYAAMFVLNYTFRLFALYQAVRAGGFRRHPFADTFLYLALAPYFAIVPYMLAIPRFDVFQKSLARRSPAIERAGLRNLALGLILESSFILLNGEFPVRRLAAEAALQGRILDLAPLTLLDYPVWAYFSIVGPALTLTGLQQLLSIDVDPPFDHPLASRGVLDWWRRWNTHFRRLLVDLFFYPVLLRLRRRSTARAIVAASLAVFIVGSTLFHLPKFVITHQALRMDWGVLCENSFFAVAVALALLLERRRHAGRARPGALIILRTWVLVYLGVRAGTVVSWLTGTAGVIR